MAAPRPDLAFPLRRVSRLVPGEPFFRMREAEGEPNSETRIEVIDRDGPWWRYALHPLTGRKHQLRVHLAALGAPIRNDPLYPVLRPPDVGDYSRPLQLLARHLAFLDPLTGIERRFESQFRL
jgi:tRNA pseudouridine32 synthase / 23S rRNA pseudouridine746 synthase